MDWLQQIILSQTIIKWCLLSWWAALSAHFLLRGLNSPALVQEKQNIPSWATDRNRTFSPLSNNILKSMQGFCSLKHPLAVIGILTAVVLVLATKRNWGEGDSYAHLIKLYLSHPSQPLAMSPLTSKWNYKLHLCASNNLNLRKKNYRNQHGHKLFFSIWL